MPHLIRRICASSVSLCFGATLLIAPFVLAGCEDRQNPSATRTVTDPVMSAAETQGRTTFTAFLRAFASPEPGWGSFQVRHAYTTENGFVDHLWLDLNAIGDNNQLLCTVPTDEDERAIRFQPGEELTIDPGTVNDWMFIAADGSFVGGYTLRVTMDRIGNTHDDTGDDMHGGIRFRDLEDLEPDAPTAPSP